MLEHQLGFPLFTRGRRGAVLTSAGEAFLKNAVAGAREISRAAELAAKVQQGVRGELRIGMLASLGLGPLHDILYCFRKQFPNVQISFREGTPEEIVRSLGKGDLDILFITARPEISHLTTKQLWEESVYVVMPHSHDLSRHDAVSWDDLRQEMFIVTYGGSGSEIQDYIVRKISHLGFRPRIEVHDVSRESLLTLTAMGFGLTLTRTSFVRKSVAGIVYRLVAGELNALPISAVWSAENPNPAIDGLLKIANEVIKRMASDEKRVDHPDRADGQ